VKKRIISGLLIFLMLASASFFVVYGIDSRYTFSEIVESGDLSNLRLTIYYLRGLDYIRELTPISIRELKSIRHFKIVVEGSDLVKNLDSLKELSSEPIIALESNRPVDAYVYYVFETKLGHKLYEVAMWTYWDNSIYVNGVIVNDSDIFYDVIMPYLPQDIALEFEDLINRSREYYAAQN